MLFERQSNSQLALEQLILPRVNDHESSETYYGVSVLDYQPLTCCALKVLRSVVLEIFFFSLQHLTFESHASN